MYRAGILFFAWVFLLTGLSCFGFAQEGLEVTGIFYDGKDPVAIVNKEMVKKNDRVQGYQVIDITKESVAFRGAEGVFSVTMAEQIPPAPKQNAQKQKASFIQTFLENLKGLFSRGNQKAVVKKEPLGDYGLKALAAYGEAQRAGNPGEACRHCEEAIKQAQFELPHSREEMERIVSECREMARVHQENVASAKSEKKIIPGMTPADVVTVMGRPSEKHEAAYGLDQKTERWAYEREQAYLTFENGVLVSVYRIKPEEKKVAEPYDED